MFRKIQQHIYKQPRSVRDQYAFAGAVICTGLIALVWVTTGPGVVGGNVADTTAQAPAAEQTSAQPFSRMFDSIQEGVRSRWSSMQESVAPVSEEAVEADGTAVDAPSAGEPAAPRVATSSAPATTSPRRAVQIATSSPAVATSSDAASTTSPR